MVYCKKCNCELNKSNTYIPDKRFCTKCGNNYLEYKKARRIALYCYRAMPLNAKINKTKSLIMEAINEFGLEHVYISYSGGKDSTVLSNIAKELYPNILHIFANTTCEYPETIKHIKWEKEFNKTNIITVYPIDTKGTSWSFKKVVDKYGYPIFSKRISNAIRTYQHAKTEKTKNNSLSYINRNFKKYSQYKEYNISDKCCDLLKKEPIKRMAKQLNMKCALIAILADESKQREKDWIDNGCNVFYKKNDNQSRPLAFWTEKDIYDYIALKKIKISDLYKKQYTRNGCMYCGFGVHLEPIDNNRFVKLKKTHLIHYNYLVNNFGDFLKSLNINF